MIMQRQVETIVSKCVEETIITISLRKDEDEFLIELESKLCNMVKRELGKAGVSMQKKRRAMVMPGKAELLQVQNYLPHNYKAYSGFNDCILIEGYDNAGWTLHGYVIPRLSSGLIFAKEIYENV